MEELLEEIQEIQKYLYGGHKVLGSSNIQWLNVSFSQIFCLNFFSIDSDLYIKKSFLN